MKEDISKKSIEEREEDLTKYFTEEELEKSIQELKYMESHLDEYKSYGNVDDLFRDLDK